MVMIKTTGWLYSMDNDAYDEADVVPLVFDTNDVLYAQQDTTDSDYTLIVLRERQVNIYIRMSIDAYSAIVTAGVEHLTTYGQIAG